MSFVSVFLLFISISHLIYASSFRFLGPPKVVGLNYCLPMSDSDMNAKHDLWIVGAGSLGEFAADKWIKKSGNLDVIAETFSTTRHNLYKTMGLAPRLRVNRAVEDKRSALNVLVCLAPSCVKNPAEYVQEVSEAADLWAGPSQGGRLLFTSSIGVYGESCNATVNESSAVDRISTRSASLLAAEDHILGRGGSVVRLSGLYSLNRGPHSYWMKRTLEGQPIESYGESLVNLLHYEDAADIAVTILRHKGDADRRLFLAVDDEPITKREICEETMKLKQYENCNVPQFTGSAEQLKRMVCDNTQTRTDLNWSPTFPSFRKFIRRLKEEQDV